MNKYTVGILLASIIVLSGGGIAFARAAMNGRELNGLALNNGLANSVTLNSATQQGANLSVRVSGGQLVGVKQLPTR